MGSLDVSLDGYIGGKIESLFIGVSLGSTDGELFISDEGIILGIYDG